MEHQTKNQTENSHINLSSQNDVINRTSINTSIKEFLNKCKEEKTNLKQIVTKPTQNYLWNTSHDNVENTIHNPYKSNSVLIEIDIIYNEEDIKSTASLLKENNNQSIALSCHKHSARLYMPSDKLVDTFLEDELLKTTRNYMKIEVQAKKNKINIESILDCFEYLLDKNYEFNFTKENLISYFYAFSLCKLKDKQREVLERLLMDLSDENIAYFLKVVSTLDDDFLSSYSFWLLRYLVNKSEKGDKINFNGYDFENIVKLTNNVTYSFDANRIFIHSKTTSLSANVNFLKKYYEQIHKIDLEKYFKVNNHFNMGRVIRRKSDSNLVDDYPHYYQLLLENEPEIVLFAIRQSENSNFIISRSIDDFSKYGINYVAEVSPNFWGTHFELFDYGYEKTVYDKYPKSLCKLRDSIVI